jgi:hypothetical protein
MLNQISFITFLSTPIATRTRHQTRMPASLWTYGDRSGLDYNRPEKGKTGHALKRFAFDLMEINSEALARREGSSVVCCFASYCRGDRSTAEDFASARRLTHVSHPSATYPARASGKIRGFSKFFSLVSLRQDAHWEGWRPAKDFPITSRDHAAGTVTTDPSGAPGPVLALALWRKPRRLGSNCGLIEVTRRPHHHSLTSRSIRRRRRPRWR